MEYEDKTEQLLARERTLLASERTFSAWIRTALAAMAGGLAILRLVIFKSDLHRVIGHIIGEMLILWGCLLIILASLDYKKMRDSLTVANHYKSSQIGLIIIVVPLVIISILLVWITLP